MKSILYFFAVLTTILLRHQKNFTMKNLSLLLFFATLLLPSCKDNEPYNPYGFRCKVNGVDWTPAIPEGSQWGGANATNFQYYDDVQFIGIFAKRSFTDQSVNQSMTFSAEQVSLGENKIKYRKRIFKDWHVEGNCGQYDLDTLKPHIINIEVLDRENRIISGTFQFSVHNRDYRHNGEDCVEQSIDITDGEFEFGF